MSSAIASEELTGVNISPSEDEKGDSSGVMVLASSIFVVAVEATRNDVVEY